MKSWNTGGDSKKIELLTCQVQVSRNWGWCQNGNRWTLSLWKHLNLPHAWKGMYHTARQRPTLSFSPSSLHPAMNLVKHPTMAIHQHDSLKEREQRLAPRSHRETRNYPWTAYALQAKSVLHQNRSHLPLISSPKNSICCGTLIVFSFYLDNQTKESDKLIFKDTLLANWDNLKNRTGMVSYPDI